MPELTLKVTDDSYTIPNIFALIAHDIFTSGATQPRLIQGRDRTTSELGEYVVKYYGGMGMGFLACAKELLGAYLAKQLEINAMEPVLIEVSKAFVENLRGKEGFAVANKSIGLNIGTKFRPSGLSFKPEQSLTDEQKKQAMKIFAFDVFINNVDRNLRKPNMLAFGDDIYVFDHEKAFSFVEELPFMRNQTPWILREVDMNWVTSHIFYPYLKNKDYSDDSLNEFIQSMDQIDASFWQKVESLFPEQWLDERFITITDFLTQIIDHKNEFKSELERVLQ